MPMEVAYTPKADGEAGPILGRIEWNSKAGKLMRVDRTKNETTGGWDSTRADISTIDQPDGSVVRPSMLFDFASGQNGWVRFQPYDEVMVPIDARLPPRPPEYRDEAGKPVLDKYGKTVRHDQIIKVPVYAPKFFGAEAPIRELSLKGANAINAFAAFYGEVEAAPDFAAGKLPLVQWLAAKIIDNKGNGVPVFKVLGWFPRPAEFAKRQIQFAAEPAVQQAAPARQASPAPAPELVDDIPF